MLEKWKSAAGNRKSFEELLTDLSKAQEEHVRKFVVICPSQLAGDLLMQMLKYFEVMLNIFDFSHVKEILES